jgi:hypothetical protein
MYVFYVEYDWHKMDFVIKQAYILVVQRFPVVYLFHLDDNLDAKQVFVHYLPTSKKEYEQGINIIQKNLHSEDKGHKSVYVYFV